jgi:beta-lactamase superfamily II metal-dependent hydrolase
MPILVKWVIIVAISLLYLFVPWTTYGQELDIDVLDIGQGDSILIRTPQHHTILIDGGPDESVIDQLDEVLPFWSRSIDVILPTHPQADHINGLVAVLQRFSVNQEFNTPAKANINAYFSIKREIEQQKITQRYFMRGEAINTDDNVSIKSLWPPPNSNWDSVADLNDVAQVCLLQYQNFRALFTADAGANIDQQLEKLGDAQPVDMLKVAHHGSATGTDEQFLKSIHPYISVISVGASNNYGHPALSTLQQLQSVNSQVWRTDQDGRVEVSVNYAGISVKSTKIRYNKP